MESSSISDAQTRPHIAAEKPLRLDFPSLVNDIFDIVVRIVALWQPRTTSWYTSSDAVTFIQLLELKRFNSAGKLKKKESHFANHESLNTAKASKRLNEKLKLNLPGCANSKWTTKWNFAVPNFGNWSQSPKQFIFYSKLNHKVLQLSSHKRHNSYCYDP